MLGTVMAMTASVVTIEGDALVECCGGRGLEFVSEKSDRLYRVYGA